MQNYLEFTEFMNLLTHAKALSEKITALIALMGYCGLRLAEATHLKVQDLSFAGVTLNTIQLSPAIAKKASAREIIIPDPLKPILASWITVLKIKHPEYVWLFPGHGDKPMTNRNAQIAIRRLGTQALNRHITPHTLRHTFATLLARSAPIRVVQQALGHKALSSTMIYTHVNRSDLEKGIAAAFPPTPPPKEAAEKQISPLYGPPK